jgi:hypothetical protein
MPGARFGHRLLAFGKRRIGSRRGENNAAKPPNKPPINPSRGPRLMRTAPAPAVHTRVTSPYDHPSPSPAFWRDTESNRHAPDPGSISPWDHL